MLFLTSLRNLAIISAAGALVFFLAAGFAAAQIRTDPQCGPDSVRDFALKQAQAGTFSYAKLAGGSMYLGNLKFQNADGKTVSLSDYAGKVLLVNLWGVWCPPCRAEIEDLSKLQAAHGGNDFAVVTVYDYASKADKVKEFLAQHNAQNLPMNHDADMSLYNALKTAGLARGLPVSLLADKRGCLIASLNGGAPWGSDDAWKFIEAVIKR